MLRTIFWALVLILALSFFGISIQAIVNSPAGQENFTYVFGVLSHLWQLIMHIAAKVWQWSTFWVRPPGA
ncbi:hypothetical protein KGQ72_01435 [Patescibacteria group bacterium]|nr:hypothetical protein [Patescibacteria group bacterium]